ncbi:YAK1 (YJL141C) [Zygosaccharomyces parabailii]|nr:YAK1 (YJL141C) [Zygosaccharomyces parabailii]CDH09463.1 related to Dual specificity protein kinase YAK1 [Zygosaccharomyces bailii ISA1307]
MWNPLYLTTEDQEQLKRQRQQQQQQQQQQQSLPQRLQQIERRQSQPQRQQQVQFTFTNPWGDNRDLDPYYPQNSGSGTGLDGLPEAAANPLLAGEGSDSFDAYRRRKSSLVIPPARAPNPNPFEYDDRNAYAGVYDAQRQNQIRSMLLAQQQQQLTGSGFIPATLYGAPCDLNRRQSVAAVHYPPRGPNNMGSPSGPPSLKQASGAAATMSPYRRLSCYPPSTSPTSSLQPPYKQLRRDGGGASAATSAQSPMVGAGQQMKIPQMKMCNAKSDLKPTLNTTPKFRRASLSSKTISPIIALTKGLITTYSLCSPDFSYQTSKNPKRVLTKPSEGKFNGGYDNINSDYILYVNDVLGTEQNRKYLVLDILGQGTFGQVVKCQNILTKDIVAVKVVKSREEHLTQSITEARILDLLNTKVDPMNQHHILQLHDTFVHKNHLCLVFELLSNNLYELLKQNQFHGLSMRLIRTFTAQLLDALCVLKDSKLVHCDLKPENVLLCSPDRPDLKVIDFGSSCEERRTIYTYIQSRFYRAPEVLLGIPYSTSIDMWSLGCIVAELFLGIPILPGVSEFNQVSRIVECLGYPPAWMLDMGKNTTRFMKKLDSATDDNKSLVDSDVSMLGTQTKYRLKTVEEYNEQYCANEQPSKQYFKWTKMPDIIKNYRYSKKIKGSQELIEQEQRDRDCLIHFLSGILNINPLERWTPQQASMHPFVTQQHFTGEWYPPGSLQATSNSAPPGMNKKFGSMRHPSLQDGTAKEFDKLRIGED